MFAPIRAFGPPALDWVGPMPYPALQSMFDGLYPPGHQWYWKADFVKELSDEAIAHARASTADSCRRGSRRCTSIRSTARPAEVASDATAWNYRDANWAQVIVGVNPDPADNEQIIAWTRDYWEALHPTRPAAPTST